MKPCRLAKDIAVTLTKCNFVKDKGLDRNVAYVEQRIKPLREAFMNYELAKTIEAKEAFLLSFTNLLKDLLWPEDY